MREEEREGEEVRIPERKLHRKKEGDRKIHRQGGEKKIKRVEEKANAWKDKVSK
jgi:hypothetical protein